jgi:hypothetical protein
MALDSNPGIGHGVGGNEDPRDKTSPYDIYTRLSTRVPYAPGWGGGVSQSQTRRHQHIQTPNATHTAALGHRSSLISFHFRTKEECLCSAPCVRQATAVSVGLVPFLLRPTSKLLRRQQALLLRELLRRGFTARVARRVVGFNGPPLLVPLLTTNACT